MILALFDIDGTLLSSDGLARRVFAQALQETFGTAGPVADHDFGGKTDPLIVDELLTLAGWELAAIAERRPAALERYLDLLELELATGEGIRLLPGARRLLEVLENDPEVLLGVLTGNVARGARLKLSAVGLEGFFRLGAYGSDHSERDRLPPIAARRALELVGQTFAGPQVVIIGDTPRDIQCAHASGARALAVATGRHAIRELESHLPQHVFPTLEATDEVIKRLKTAS